jgi:hypothetical protein
MSKYGVMIGLVVMLVGCDSDSPSRLTDEEAYDKSLKEVGWGDCHYQRIYNQDRSWSLSVIRCPHSTTTVGPTGKGSTSTTLDSP